MVEAVALGSGAAELNTEALGFTAAAGDYTHTYSGERRNPLLNQVPPRLPLLDYYQSPMFYCQWQAHLLIVWIHWVHNMALFLFPVFLHFYLYYI